MIPLLNDYPYLYETHLHTSQSSRCAKNTGAQMARAAKAAGYTGIFVTDHHWGGNTAADHSLPWADWVHAFSAGYRDARKEGDRIGLDVFFGWEAGFSGTEFLIYGLTPDWMIDHPELRTFCEPENEEGFTPLTPELQYQLVHSAGGMVIHAHPFREESYIPEIRLYPECVDGVEVINATHSNPMSKAHNDPAFDERARAYARKYSLPATAGSDMHWTELFGGGMAFSHPLCSPDEYIAEVISGGNYVMTNGVEWFDRYGNPVA